MADQGSRSKIYGSCRIYLVWRSTWAGIEGRYSIPICTHYSFDETLVDLSWLMLRGGTSNRISIRDSDVDKIHGGAVRRGSADWSSSLARWQLPHLDEEGDRIPSGDSRAFTCGKAGFVAV